MTSCRSFCGSPAHEQANMLPPPCLLAHFLSNHLSKLESLLPHPESLSRFFFCCTCSSPALLLSFLLPEAALNTSQTFGVWGGLGGCNNQICHVKNITDLFVHLRWGEEQMSPERGPGLSSPKCVCVLGECVL